MSRRILLLSPKYYGIENVIGARLKSLDYEVDWIENKNFHFDYHVSKTNLRLLRRIYFLLFSPHIYHIKRAIKKLEGKSYDVLFSINAYSVSPYLFKKLKKRNQSFHSILYIWDSSSMYNWTSEIKLFDRVYTFDPDDAAKYNISYKPNFYVKQDDGLTSFFKNDLYFVGKFNLYRYLVIEQINDMAQKKDITLFIKLWPWYKTFYHNYFIYFFLKRIKASKELIVEYVSNYEAVEGIFNSDFVIKQSISFDDIQRHMLNSKVVLDLPYPKQKGYTHRLIDALAKGKKVITTNLQIKSEQFYNSDQIHLLDSVNPNIDFNWVKEDVSFPADEFILNLELSIWLKSILNE
ncbi:MAG: hypothetical protein CVU05_13595 [Bacteroidetes bacterium HGW-Bacteroidetes-21]|nr:MAG: hypothetical protein CVU05_13595 [Bacteroidetes bacterium HGW-Bacteroidetes-21]